MGSKAEKKVVVAGKYCVGKTALVTRFTKNRFCELSPYQPTIGAAFVAKRVIVGTKCVNLGIWDTAGSERFESVSTLYYRGAKAAIVCYDLTDSSSFEKAKFYVTEIAKHNEDCWIYLCGTKRDLVNSGERNRDVPYDAAVNYSQKVNAKTVMETSSKTGQNVDELFLRIAQDILQEIATDDTVPALKLEFQDPSRSPQTAPCRCKT
ncbi:ras-related protein Rab-24-like isoform X1 [Orbicella faveolata]|uniref:ras-related protein Rab-24-like isoform X1 n=1 Tax=Orbicella faveolata TaxID=48498 RepID=UPI0009E24430|nr:ras-related protein Rab-24-like isoform X1 [Orbicella faveolata]